MRFVLSGAGVLGAIVFGLLARVVGGGLDTQHFHSGSDSGFLWRWPLAAILGLIALLCAIGALAALIAKDDP